MLSSIIKKYCSTLGLCPAVVEVAFYDEQAPLESNNHTCVFLSKDKNRTAQKASPQKAPTANKSILGTIGIFLE